MLTELKKELSLYGLTMVAIGSCIGSGIFLTPSQIAGYLPAPLIFITITFLFVVNALIAKPLHAWAGLILMAASLPIYFYFKRRSGDRS